jgi:hypothetical protein
MQAALVGASAAGMLAPTLSALPAGLHESGAGGTTMLFRRVRDHVVHQNWTAIAIDFLIVVAGVFVGTQVSSWNSDRLEQPAQAGGFSLHAGIDIEPGQRQKLERLCRYVSRPPVAVDRMALTASGQVRYTLKTPYRDGTTHSVLEPLDLMARLAALVPPPRMHLTRYHGVFAPHSKLRAAVTPAGRGRGGKPPAEQGVEPSSTPRHVAMSWAKRLMRVFAVEIEACARCGGKLKIIASIEEPAVITKILAHLERTAPDQHQPDLPLGARAPPTQSPLL